MQIGIEFHGGIGAPLVYGGASSVHGSESDGQSETRVQDLPQGALGTVSGAGGDGQVLPGSGLRGVTRLVLTIDGCDLVTDVDRCVLSGDFIGFLMFLVEI